MPQPDSEISRIHKLNFVALLVAGGVNILVFVIAFVVATPERKSLVNLVVIGTIQVFVSAMIWLSAWRIRWLGSYVIAIVFSLFLAFGHTMIPLLLHFSGEHDGGLVLKVCQIVYAFFLCCLVVLLAVGWVKSMNENRAPHDQRDMSADSQG